MSDTATQKGPDLTGVQRFAGVGLAYSWVCPNCSKHRPTLGRRMKFLKAWGRTWVCEGCVKEIELARYRQMLDSIKKDHTGKARVLRRKLDKGAA
jgi:hypothetical protein